MHIVQLYEDHNEFTPKGLKLCPKLKRAHIDLTPFSRMNVRLATNVLSDTVSRALRHVYGDRVRATCEFISMINKWFDVMNTKSIGESYVGRNPSLNVFSSLNDERFHWLEHVFLEYFKEWESNVEQRQGLYSQIEKSKMQLSHQTLKGFTITTKSIIECVQFMLQKGAKFVLTSHFNQDPLEQLFGHVRHKGGSNDNPTVYEAMHSINTIRSVNTQALLPKFGNTTYNDEIILDDTPVPRRPSHST